MNFKTGITAVFRVMAIVLVLSVLLPSVIKLTHAFNHHKHIVCNDDENQSTHFHQSDIDCNFFKFKITKQYYFNSETVQMVTIESNYNITDSQYEFASDFQKLQTALRGPPQLI